MSTLECIYRGTRGIVAGDFCDLSEPEPNRLHVAAGTLFSQQPVASLLIAGLSATLHALALRGAEPDALAEELSRTLWEIAPDRTYAALFCARLDVSRRQLQYVNAGHESALVFASGRALRRLEPNGPVLGLCRTSRYRMQREGFEPGDTLLAVTEGAAEHAAELVLAGSAQTPEELVAGAIRAEDSSVDRTAIAIHFRIGVGRFAVAA